MVNMATHLCSFLYQKAASISTPLEPGLLRDLLSPIERVRSDVMGVPQPRPGSPAMLF